MGQTTPPPVLPAPRGAKLRLLSLVFAASVALTAIFAGLGYLKALDNRILVLDSVYYFVYLRSVVFDGDLDFTNELEHFLGKGGGCTPLTKKGVPGNVWSVGPAIFWSPFYLVAHALSPEPDGYSSYYRLAVYLANTLFALAGLLATALLLLHFLKFPAAALGTLGVMLASPLTYYIWPLYPESHSVSFAFTALFLYLYATRGPTVMTAVAAGCMVLGRWQDSLFLLPVLFDAFTHVRESLQRRGATGGWRAVRPHVRFGAIVVLVFLPQVIAWRMIYGEFLLVPQGQGFFSLDPVNLGRVLLSTNHGLLLWHPLLALGIAGLVAFRKRAPKFAWSLLVVLAAQWVVNAAVLDWWAHWSFGHRRFISCLPAMALGIGCLAERYRRAVPAAILALGLWNQLFVFQYQRGLIPRVGKLSFNEFVIDKFRLGPAAGGGRLPAPVEKSPP